MALAYSTATIRAAEDTLLATQAYEDELMRSAAAAVTRIARVMLGTHRHVLILAGPGGNGGDALYAGAALAHQGLTVSVYLTQGRAHPPALAAITASPAHVVASPVDVTADLIIDGILGIGARPGLGPLPALPAAPVLAVDVPSGVAADTGVDDDCLPATVTLTFGGFRLAHALSARCGQVVCADVRTHAGSLRDALATYPATTISTAVNHHPYTFTGVNTLAGPRPNPLEPAPADTKYSQGVVGIAAGSPAYPGAAILAVTGAVHATSSMVRYAGPQATEVVRAWPEVVVTDTITATGRVQAWVYGPGCGTTDPAPLAGLLATDTPLLIDADGLTLLAHHRDLREALRARTATTVLTPHDGEFARLAQATGTPDPSRLAGAEELAHALGCVIVRKGRATIVVDTTTTIIDAGSSWAATPGSGDLLAGLLGAQLARDGLNHLADGISAHSRAAYLAAQTRFGPAPTSASGIAAHLSEALAWDGRAATVSMSVTESK